MSSFPCPLCGRKSGVIKTEVGLRKRRCGYGHTFYTIESVSSVDPRHRGGKRAGAGRKKRHGEKT